jgi:hypothetical protein
MERKPRTAEDREPGDELPAGETHDRVPPPILPPRQRRSAVRALIRSLLTVTGLVVLYYLLPLDRSFGPGTVALLLAALVLLGAVVTLQVRAIVHSVSPALRAVESLALTVPLFLLIFAAVYQLLSGSDPNAFSAPLSRTDSLYFVITVFATVGFGDITAVSQLARVLVTVQMVSDLLVLGVVVRAVATAAQRGSRNRRGDDR